jgi:uncharacterized protein (DUF111 family)
MKNSIYFDCSSGVSSDMLLGALLGLGVDADAIASGLRGLGLCEFRLRAEKVERRGVSGYAAVIEIVGPPPETARPEISSADMYHEHGHDHGHEDSHDHGDDRGGDRHAHVSHRAIAALIRGADIGSVAKKYALAAYGALAESEAAAHGVTKDEVHFHEVGSPRAVYMVCGAAIAASLLGVTDFTCGELKDGSGEIMCSHGVIPVPVPAVRELLKRTEIPLVSDPSITTELVTPSGLALLIGFGCRYAPGGDGPDVSSGSSLTPRASDPARQTTGSSLTPRASGPARQTTGYGFGARDTGLLGAVRATLTRSGE